MSATKSNAAAANVSEADVDVNMVSVPKGVQSLITQVDRNAPPVVPPKVTVRTTNLEVETESRALSQKPVRKSFFQRFLCCGGSKDTISQGATTMGPTSAYTRTRTGSGSPKQMPSKMPVLPPVTESSGKKLLALDLDETLVHSSFQPVDQASFTISVAIEGVVHNVYVIKRPGCDEFMERLAEHYELIIYTASLSKYADPLLDILDPKQLISKRLFRENCVYYDGHYVKDLSLLNREITQTIIVDNSPMSYIFHPENAIDCTSFFDDPFDVELWQIADFLVSIKSCSDVRQVCSHWREWCRNNPSEVPREHKGKRGAHF
mmetsp:Transcript_2386/g.5055  ORF Transcript_2386/g.5055 Transcript_2386/m.5055 type:complete len:320 (+) Transcript_2386:209-1168(+)